MALTLKLLGCGLLVLAGAGAGEARARSERRAARFLGSMAAFLGEVQALLRSAPCPTARLLQNALAGAAGLPLALDGLPEGPGLPGALEKALAEGRRQCPEVPERAWACFCAAVRRVGSADAPQVLPALELARRQTDQAARQAEGKARQNRRLYRALGLCAGAGAALLLV